MTTIDVTLGETVRDETITGANTAARVGQLLVDIINLITLTQVVDPIITPAVMNADVDDYGPAGFATANMIRQDVNGDNYEITGMVAPPAGVNRIIYINNISTTGDRIAFQNNNGGSVAANRLLMRGNRTCRPNETASFWYDHTSARWRQLSQIG